MSLKKIFFSPSAMCLFTCAVFGGTFLQCFAAEEMPIYKFVIKDIEGKEVSLSEFKGKVLLLVNVASECGYTDGHYRELVELQNDYSSQSFTVLAFPCNQFGKQEPKDNKSILKFVKKHYNVNFPMFEKVIIAGEHAHPLYIYLYQATSEYPKWNFAKYLVDKDGKVVKFFSQNTSPKECISFIEELLDKPINVKHTDL